MNRTIHFSKNPSTWRMMDMRASKFSEEQINRRTPFSGRFDAGNRYAMNVLGWVELRAASS
jgi:roadblock/LC7 domain-containing protein